MTANHSSRVVVSFGPFEANLETQELKKNGVRLRLPGQSFQILAMLLHRPGELIKREELRQALWPAETFVDFEKGTNAAITRLREALGDSAENPRYVETLPRRGYRFVGLVGKPAEGVPSQASAEKSTASAKWLAVGTIALLCGIGVWLLLRNRSEASLPPIEVVPLAGLTGMESEAAFSPDGNHVAFALHDSGENNGIYTTIVGSQKSLRLTTDFFDCCPRWSPDGRQVAFSRRSKDGFDLYVIPASGGTEHRLSSWPSEGPQIFRMSNLRSIMRCFDWSPDSKFIAFSYNKADRTRSQIALLSLADSTVRPLSQPQDPNLDFAPAFSPDGRAVAFIRGITAGVIEDIYSVPVSGGEPKRLTFDNKPIGAPPTWTSSGRDIVFSSMRGGPLTLWRVPVSRGEPQPIPGVGAGAWVPSVSTKGNQLLFQQFTGGGIHISRLKLRDQNRQADPATDLVSQKGGNTRPDYSADGKRIVFESDHSGYAEIWVCDSNGSDCGQFTSLHGVAGAASWSPDGQYIAFEYRPKDRSEIYLIDVRNRVPRLLPTLPGANNGGPSWSRDGKWIYFYSDRSGGAFQLWKTRIDEGTPTQVTRNGGVFGVESPDGRQLYLSKFESPGIWRMSVDGGEEVQVLDQPAGDAWRDWAVTKNGIYYLDQSQSKTKTTLRLLEFRSGKKISLATMPRTCCGLALSPDRSSILYTQREPDQSTIMLMKNFR